VVGPGEECGMLTTSICLLSTISSEANTPSSQVTLDDWTVILKIESTEGVPYKTILGQPIYLGMIALF